MRLASDVACLGLRDELSGVETRGVHTTATVANPKTKPATNNKQSKSDRLVDVGERRRWTTHKNRMCSVYRKQTSRSSPNGRARKANAAALSVFCACFQQQGNPFSLCLALWGTAAYTVIALCKCTARTPRAVSYTHVFQYVYALYKYKSRPGALAHSSSSK